MFTILLALFLPLFADAKVPFHCPDSLTVNLTLDSFQDATASPFSTLSGSNLAERLVRLSSDEHCVFQSEESRRPTEKKLFLAISRSGSRYKIALDGYTSSGEMFEVRAYADGAPADWSGDYAADVYDASGPARTHLGTATLRISE